MSEKRPVNFGIEPLESRILLSATPLMDAAFQETEDQNLYASTLNVQLEELSTVTSSTPSSGLIPTNGEDVVFQEEQAAVDGNTIDSVDFILSGTEAGTGFTQVSITGEASISGALNISLAEGFDLQEGDEFEIITFDSSTGDFSSSTGLYGFGNGDLYLSINKTDTGITLVAEKLPGSGLVFEGISSELNELGDALNNDYFQTGASIEFSGTLNILDVLHVNGTIGFGFNIGQSFDVATGVTADDVSGSTELSTLLTSIDALLGVSVSADKSTITGLKMGSMVMSVTNVSAFLGAGDPIFGESGITNSSDLFGFALNDFDGIFGAFTPLANIADNSIPSFLAVNATVGSVEVLGMDGILTMSFEDLSLAINTGVSWPDANGPPVIDFASTFAASGGAYNPGASNGLTFDFDGNERYTFDVGGSTLRLFNLLHLNGSFGFDFGASIEDASTYGNQIFITSHQVVSKSWYDVKITTNLEAQKCNALLEKYFGTK